ncbi:MAG: hypothetical protein LAO03_01925 [Acidobacteriia bacterium]|nr:hypothetical protein [Terriglobia bacterium]
MRAILPLLLAFSAFAAPLLVTLALGEALAFALARLLSLWSPALGFIVFVIFSVWLVRLLWRCALSIGDGWGTGTKAKS